jgi:choline dehydrogenase-like flavoprotein
VVQLVSTMDDRCRVIVIGSGPSGAIAALTLLEHGIPVTLLESGAAFPKGLIVRAFGRNLFRKWAPRDDPEYAHVATRDPKTFWPHALQPGGLSNQWTGAVPRFAPEDFYEGARLHERYRWPIQYRDLADHYTRAERLLGVVGEVRRIPQASPPEALVWRRELPRAWRGVAEHAEAVGNGLNYAPVADGPRWLVRRSGAAFNSFERIVSRLYRFTHFELRLGAHAQRLSWNSELGRVDGVEYLDRTTGVTHHIGANAVVVAAGPLASAKLLLHSTSGAFPNGLGNNNDLVGRFVHDHPNDWCVLNLDTPLPRLDQQLHFTRAPYADSPPLTAALLTIGALSKWDRLLSATGASTNRFGLVTFATMLPDEHNYVRLHPERRDKFGMPALDVHVEFGSEVPRAIAAAHERLIETLQRAGVSGTIECDVDRLRPGWSAHYGGTVRMHASPEYGVLDGWNRIHGVRNVAVVDASSFTTAVEKNPTLTVMALASRAASRLAEDLLQESAEASSRHMHAVAAIR